MSLTLLSVARQRVSVSPGASVELVVTVQNLTSLLDQVALRLDGLDPGWVQVIPPYLPVFAQGQASARIRISPPRDAARSIAGLYPIIVRAASRENPGEEGTAQAELEVQLDGTYQAMLGPAESHAGEVSYTLAVQNAANAPLTLRFHAQDAGGLLWYRFDPYELHVPAGQQANAALSIKPRQTVGMSKDVPFSVTIEGVYGLTGGSEMSAPSRNVSGQYTSVRPPELRISLLPEQVADQSPAYFQALVSNPGTARVTMLLTAQGQGDNLSFRIEPQQLHLGPQSEGTARVTVFPRTLPPPGQRWEQPFQVTAQPEDRTLAAATARAVYIQNAAMPVKRGFPWLLVAVALVLVAVVILIVTLTVQR